MHADLNRQAKTTGARYGDWTITFDPPPIPSREHDYQFWHEDYDGAPDAWDGGSDPRCGTAASLEACKTKIDEIEEEIMDD